MNNPGATLRDKNPSGSSDFTEMTYSAITRVKFPMQRSLGDSSSGLIDPSCDSATGCRSPWRAMSREPHKLLGIRIAVFN